MTIKKISDDMKNFVIGLVAGFVVSAASFLVAVMALRPMPIDNTVSSSQAGLQLDLGKPKDPPAIREFASRDYTQACAEDVKNLCPGLAFGRGAGGCLLKAQDRLSEECRRQVPEIQSDLNLSAKKRPFVSICADDLVKHCAGMGFGSGAGKCLVESKNKLSKACRGQLAAIEKDRLENP